MTKADMLPIPPEVFDQHVAVLGKTRSGKSSVMRLLVEYLLRRDEPICIVDPKGDWWGIKLAADGKDAGFPVVIFGGEHADIPINEHAGASVGEMFATGNKPCLIDLGGWMPNARTRFWIDFASTLFKHTKGRRWLIVDEVHNFAPKGKVLDVDAGKALHWTNRLASEGLGKGVAMLFASQRPQKVHNDTLTSAETLIAMRVLHPSDRGAVSDWIKGCGDSEGSEVLNSLAQMQRGEGWVWSPEIGFGPRRVQFPMFTTYDSFRPQTVADTRRLKGWAEVDLEEVRERFAAITAEATANDPKELQKRVKQLENEIAKAKKAVTCEACALRERELQEAQAATKSILANNDALRARLGEIEGVARRLGEMAAVDKLVLARPVVDRPFLTKHVPPATQPRTFLLNEQHTTHVPKREAKPAAPRLSAPVDGDFQPNSAQQRVLNALAFYRTVGVDAPGLKQVGFIAKIKASGGHFQNTVGPLSSRGLIERTDGRISLTSAGEAYAVAPDTPPTLSDYHASIRDMLRTGAQQRVFDAIASRGGAAVTVEEIGEATSIDPTGGHFQNSIGPLVTLGVVTRSKGIVQPTDVMFPPELS